MNRWLTGTLVLLAATAVHAQSGSMEEIVVTAQKREQTLQEVPVAVSVVTGETIEQAQINDILELQTIVPALRVTQQQTTGNTNFVIRGFGNGANNAGVEPSVGVFVDGVYRSRSAAAITDLPNLERIEVLRGPQSTLFGKNASAGVINVVTRAADPALLGDRPSGSLAVTLGNYDQRMVRGDVSVRLTDDAGASLFGYTNDRDGYFTNLASGATLNERSRWGLRGEVFLAPTDRVTVRTIADVDHIEERCCGVANLVNGPTGAAIIAVGGQLVAEDAFARAQYLDFEPVNDIENFGLSTQIDVDVTDAVQVTSITAYRELDRYENADIDFTSAALVAANAGQTDISTFTQELRISGQHDRFDWLVGGFWFSEDISQETRLTYGDAFRSYADLLASGGVSATETALGAAPGSYFAPGLGIVDTARQEDSTWSLFAQADWYLNERTTITVGLNWTDVEKDAAVSQVNSDTFSGLDFVEIGFGGAFATLTGGLPPTPDNLAANATAAAQAEALSTTSCSAQNPPPACNELLALTPLQFLPPFQNYPNAVERGTTQDDELTWTARIAYDLTATINVYASASTGFKATSWNLSRDARPTAADLAALTALGLDVNNIVAGTRFAGPEASTVYELGLKGRWNRGYVNAAVFDQTIEGFQANIFTGAAFTLANAGEQSTRGIELDALWSVTDALDLTFSGIFMDPEYDSFPNSPLGDLSGQQPAGIHAVSLTVAGTWYFDIGDVNGFARLDYLHEDEVQAVDNVPAEIASRAVNLVNASVSFAWQDRWEFMVWGRNLTNDDYLLTAFPAVAQAGSFSGYPNAPRTWGVTLRARFE